MFLDQLSLPVYGQLATALFYLPAFLLYGLYHRSNTIFDYKINLMYMSLWNFLIPLMLHITQWMMIYNIYNTITTLPNNIPKRKSTRNSNKNSRGTGSESNLNEISVNIKNEGKNNKDEKKTTIISFENGERIEAIGITPSEFIKTPLDKVIDEEEMDDTDTNLPKEEHSVNDNAEIIINGDLKDRVSISNSSFTKKRQSEIILSGSSNRYSGQTDNSETILVDNGSGSNSNTTSNVIFPINTINITFNVSSPSYPISESNDSNSDNSNDNTEIVSVNDDNDNHRSIQRREWLIKRPVSLNRSKK